MLRCFPFREVRDRIRRNEEIHETKELQDWLQRELTDRSDDIAEYLDLNRNSDFLMELLLAYMGENHNGILFRCSLRCTLIQKSVNEDVKLSMGILRIIWR